MANIPKVKEVMDKRFVTLEPDLNVYSAINTLLKKKITSVAVVDKDRNLIGVLSEKDCLHPIVHGFFEGLPGGQVCEYMTKETMTISSDVDILTAGAIFLKENFSRLFVVDNGKLMGQVTRRALLQTIHHEIKDKRKFNHITGRFHAKDPTSVTASK